MNNEYPLYPKLSDEAKEQAEAIINKFKEDMVKVSKAALDNIYTEVGLYIETDSWANFRNEIMEGFMNYDNRKIQNEYDFKKIRQKIYREFREDIIGDLNQDNLKEIERLKEEIRQLRAAQKSYY